MLIFVKLILVVQHHNVFISKHLSIENKAEALIQFYRSTTIWMHAKIYFMPAIILLNYFDYLFHSLSPIAFSLKAHIYHKTINPIFIVVSVNAIHNKSNGLVIIKNSQWHAFRLNLCLRDRNCI